MSPSVDVLATTRYEQAGHRTGGLDSTPGKPSGPVHIPRSGRVDARRQILAIRWPASCRSIRTLEVVGYPEPRVRRLRFLLVIIAVSLIVVPFGFVLLQVIVDGPLVSLDHRVAAAVFRFDLSNPTLVSSARLVTRFGSTPALVTIVILATVFLIVSSRRRRDAVFLIATAVVGTIANNAIKIAVGRDRPHFSPAVATAFGKSFPSGHAMNSTVIFGALFVLVWPTLRGVRRKVAPWLVIAAIVAICASRVVLEVHYLSDVLAGVILGAAVVCASSAAFMLPTRHERPESHGTTTSVAKRSLP